MSLEFICSEKVKAIAEQNGQAEFADVAATAQRLFACAIGTEQALTIAEMKIAVAVMMTRRIVMCPIVDRTGFKNLESKEIVNAGFTFAAQRFRIKPLFHHVIVFGSKKKRSINGI
jgi:hypothetical protein